MPEEAPEEAAALNAESQVGENGRQCITMR